MKRELWTFSEWWNNLWGKSYVVNHNTKEIHRLKYKHANCHTDKMTNNEYVTRLIALKLLKNGYNGCAFCWDDKNTG